MSILIRGMEMPTKGYRLILVDADGTAYTTDGETTAVSVPEPHGGLIDADAFKQYCQTGMEDSADLFFDESYKAFAEALTSAFLQDIDEQPTIIPASEEE